MVLLCYNVRENDFGFYKKLTEINHAEFRYSCSVSHGFQLNQNCADI